MSMLIYKLAYDTCICSLEERDMPRENWYFLKLKQVSEETFGVQRYSSCPSYKPYPKLDANRLVEIRR